jgi:hypothetical protein
MLERVIRRSAVLTVGAALAAVGCSLVLTTQTEQCTVDADCAARGPAFAGTVCESRVCVTKAVEAGSDAAADAQDPIWGCLGSVVFPPAKKPKVTISLPLYELISKAPVSNILVRPCARLDVSCTNPLAAPVAPDAKGIVTFQVDAGFDGYAEILPTVVDGGLPNYVPSLAFFSPPPSDDTLYAALLLLTPSSLATLAATAGNAIDPKLGAVFFVAQNCAGKAAEGVSVTTDRTEATTKGFYLIKGLPSETASATDAAGYGGFINLPTGYVRVNATVHDTGKPIGGTSVLVRPSTISYVYLVPSP